MNRHPGAALGMRKSVLAFLLVLLMTPALAQKSVQFKAGAVSIGDPVQKLLQVAGKPERIQPFPGMPEFQRYEYFSEGRNVVVTVRDGKVTGVAALDFVSK